MQYPASLDEFADISHIDAEFRSSDGNSVEVVCLVAKDERSGKISRYWRDDLLRMKRPPFASGPDALVTSYFGSAEWRCFLSLGWQVEWMLDLHSEHRVDTNGRWLPTGNSLLGALALRGISHIDAAHKDAMRDLILMKTSWTPDEQRRILDYCESDVEALASLYKAMTPSIDLPRALLRGKYSGMAVGKMESVGIPIDGDTRQRLVAGWPSIRERLIATMDNSYGVFSNGRFNRRLFNRYLAQNKIPWPTSDSGLIKTDEDTFKDQALIWPQLEPLRQLKQTIDKMYLPSLPVGDDGFCRGLLSPFASKTGRNQPAAKTFPFASAKWQRGIIQAPPGYGLSYIDYSSQEPRIAAALSQDQRLIDACNAEDLYLAVAMQIGLAPVGATKQTHGRLRDLVKKLIIGTNYGLGVERMALQAGISADLAGEIMQRHRQTYPRYWRWLEEVVSGALLTGRMTTMFGWKRTIHALDRPTSLMNFPMQAHGAEMMRLAAIAGIEAGIQICCPVHDAFLIIAPLERLDEDTRHMRELMSAAGRVIASNVLIPTSFRSFRGPERYMDADGSEMWNRIMGLAGMPERVVP